MTWTEELAAAVGVGAVAAAYLVVGALTALGQARRTPGRRPLVLVALLLWPAAWVRWYVADGARPAGPPAGPAAVPPRVGASAAADDGARRHRSGVAPPR